MPDSVVPEARAREAERWMVGPSAIGSENGTPSSMTSRPRRYQRLEQVGCGAQIRISSAQVGDESGPALAAGAGEGRRDLARVAPSA